jgi:hypothetical protein
MHDFMLAKEIVDEIHAARKIMIHILNATKHNNAMINSIHYTEYMKYDTIIMNI